MPFTVYRHAHADYSWATDCATRVDRDMGCDTLTPGADATLDDAITYGREHVGRQSFGETTGKSFSVRDASGNLIHWS